MFEGQGRNVLENFRVEEAIEQLLMYTKAVQEAETVFYFQQTAGYWQRT